jgi:hypothetical protein
MRALRAGGSYAPHDFRGIRCDGLLAPAAIRDFSVITGKTRKFYPDSLDNYG